MARDSPAVRRSEVDVPVLARGPAVNGAPESLGRANYVVPLAVEDALLVSPWNLKVGRASDKERYKFPRRKLYRFSAALRIARMGMHNASNPIFVPDV